MWRQQTLAPGLPKEAAVCRIGHDPYPQAVQLRAGKSIVPGRKVGTFSGRSPAHPFSSSFSSTAHSAPAPSSFPHRTADAHHVHRPPVEDPWGPLKVSAKALAAAALGPGVVLDESQLEGNHLVVDCTIEDRISSHALIDCGASGFAFVDEQFVSQHNLPRYQLRMPHALQVIDGRPISSGDIVDLVRVSLDI